MGGYRVDSAPIFKLGKLKISLRLIPNYLQVGSVIIRTDENAVNIGGLDNLLRVNPSFHGYLQKVLSQSIGAHSCTNVE